ncbi:DUF2829 domain-containing protein [Xenorhabdus sp. PB61.4]|uniref:DUF2829 domain-containing protein n=1 Tax=Xenorhabdus sp. PB61.4 TaxID=2788940 RepID=UPI001E5FEE9F|nr:DUF2829 domain-containing protein [Xenorhabdus sp. PB61.4]MCC8367959.1 DUF2829 domain-containing protein [Xenorhabdus sp. PB61.4]
MSDVNKLDNKQCPFDPEQYKVKKTKAVNVEFEVDGLPPVGTFPWAIIQVYLGHWVRRDGWSPSSEYIKLIPSSTSNDGKNIPPQIGIVEKNSELTSWQPTQDDMMSCDWNLVKIKPKPVECMLSFDLEIGTWTWPDSEQMWGYLADNELNPANPFGTLTNLKNKTDIMKFSYFVWDSSGPNIDIRVSSDTNPSSYQKMVTLLQKELTVTVDGASYHLGSAIPGSMIGQQKFEFFGTYSSNSDAPNLGDFLKQNVGNTTPIHFCFNWK